MVVPMMLFLAKFKPTGGLDWASYYGGSQYDLGNSIYAAGSGSVYLAGYTISQYGIATSGAYKSSWSGSFDIFLAKFNFLYQNDAGIDSVISPSDSACAGNTQIKIRLRNFGSHTLTSALIGWVYNGVIQTPYSWSGTLVPGASTIVDLATFTLSSGSNGLKAWTYKPNGKTDSLPDNDTTILNFKVSPSFTANTGKARSVCSGTYDTIGAAAVTGHSYLWSSTPISVIASVSNPVVNPTTTTKYYLFETNAYGCTKEDSVILTVNPLPIANAGTDTMICAGDSILLGTSAVSGYSYSWSSSPAGFSSSIANPWTHPMVNTNYYLSLTNTATGCVGRDTLYTLVNALPHATFSIADTLLCIFDSLSVTNTSTGGASYQWNYGDGTFDSTSKPNPAKHHYAKAGSYIIWLRVSNKSGCFDSIGQRIFVDSSCVWPGDANGDKTANTSDVLSIGIAYHDTGFARTDTTTVWYGHPCKDWGKSFTSGANHKHADCNGDGVVDSLDLAAISLNYGKTHSKTSGANAGNPADPALSLNISKDSVGTTDTVLINMNLGTFAKPLNDIYGVCFSITYDPANTSSIASNLSKCWMGTPGKDLIYLIHNDPSNGMIDIGISRTDQKAVSGYGTLGVLSIIMPENVGGKRRISKMLQFGLVNVKAINAQEANIPLYAMSDSVLLYGYTGIAPVSNIDNQVRIFPNPARTVLHLYAGNNLISEIFVTNILGERVLTQKTTACNQTDLHVESLVPGMYFIEILTNKGLIKTRFLKE